MLHALNAQSRDKRTTNLGFRAWCLMCSVTDILWLQVDPVDKVGDARQDDERVQVFHHNFCFFPARFRLDYGSGL